MAARVSGISIMIMKENGHLVMVVVDDDEEDVEDDDHDDDGNLAALQAVLAECVEARENFGRDKRTVAHLRDCCHNHGDIDER